MSAEQVWTEFLGLFAEAVIGLIVWSGNHPGVVAAFVIMLFGVIICRLRRPRRYWK